MTIFRRIHVISARIIIRLIKLIKCYNKPQCPLFMCTTCFQPEFPTLQYNHPNPSPNHPTPLDRPRAIQHPWSRPRAIQHPWTRPRAIQHPWTRPRAIQQPWTRPPVLLPHWSRPSSTSLHRTAARSVSDQLPPDKSPGAATRLHTGTCTLQTPTTPWPLGTPPGDIL